MTGIWTLARRAWRRTAGAALAALALAAGAAGAGAADAKLPPLRDPVFLNIGFVCQWREPCIGRQQRAMRHALGYVRKHHPPAWKVQLCNRNASRNRGRGRVDWIGFNNCVRNERLQRPVARRAVSRRR
jgi:hypothetical protein